MATAPNYYYNSPHIEAAARNLADALRPEDPQKLAERQREEWKFEQLKKMTGLQETQRAEKELVETLHSGMLAEVRDPVTGEVDEKATATKRLESWQQAIEHGADPQVGAKLAGLLDPAFAVKEAIASGKAEQVYNAIRLRNAGQLDITEILEGGRNARQADAHAFTLDRDNNQYKYRLGLQADRIEGMIRAKREAAKLPGAKPPRMIPRTALEDIIYGFDLMEDEIPGGRKIPKKYKDRMIAEAEELVQQGGKVQTAINAVWAKHKLDDIGEPKAKGFFDFSGPDPVVPEGFDEPAVDPNSLGGAAIAAGAAPGMQPPADATADIPIPTARGKDGRMYPKPRGAEEYKKLMSGEDFLDPYGVVRTKP